MDNVPNTTSEIPEEVIVRREEEHAYGYIIEVLTRGLYHIKSHVIREYIQNGYDAVLELRRRGLDSGDGKIEVRVEPPSIFIYDNGIGMDAVRINEYRYVGHSRKLTHESVGFRGIGKLSGISVADQIIVSTSPVGLPQRHRLIFNARAMLTRVEQLKAFGENISLNQLIREYTALETEDEEADAHYTLVELFNVHSDSRSLLDVKSLSEYLSLTAPVDFHPDFRYGAQLDQDLRKYVNDYDTVPLYLNGERIYKLFLPNSKAPGQLFVFPSDSQTERRHIAYCWYCENADKGQFGDKIRQGFIYRVKNFSVGDNQLPRITLWETTPERSFYFFGEIHVCDIGVIPSADRSNFEQNDARDRLYKMGTATISRQLNLIAGTSSDVRRAREFIAQAEATVTTIAQAAESGEIPTELAVPKIIELNSAVDNVEKRLKKAPESHKERAKSVVQKGRNLIDTLNPGSSRKEHRSATYDIKSDLGFDQQAAWVYESIVEVLRTKLRADEFEKILLAIHQKLGRKQK